MDKLIDSVHSGDDDEVSTLNLGIIEVNESVFSLFPLIGVSLVDKFWVELVLVESWLASEEEFIRVLGGTDSTDEEKESLDNVWEEMLLAVALTENIETEVVHSSHLIS